MTHHKSHGMFLGAMALAAAVASSSAWSVDGQSVAEILGGPHPLAKVAPSGEIAQIRRVAKIIPIKTSQAQALLNGHLAPDLKLDLEKSLKDSSFRLGADGQSIFFIKRAAYAPSMALAAKQRLSNPALKDAATSFVTNKLLVDKGFQTMFKLGASESLVLTDSYSRVASFSNSTSNTTQLLSRAFVFSRQYVGVPILGPGNKVVVTLTGSGETIGLEVMLPRLEATGSKTRIISTKLFSSGLTSLGAALSSEQKGRAIRRLKCGYYDQVDPVIAAQSMPVATNTVLEPVCYVDLQSQDKAVGEYSDRLVVVIRAN